MATDVSQIGSVGSLAAAALQTAGMYLQSEMLQLVDTGMGMSLGMLLFVVSALAALFSMGIGGQYKYGLWFLFGPALFWFLIGNRVPMQTAGWRFGSEEYDSEKILAAADGVLGDSPDLAGVEVSWFFTKWDRLVSGTVEAFVDILKAGALDPKANLSFINKMERYDLLNKLDVTDPRLKLFSGIGAVSECAPYFSLIRESRDPAISPTQQEQVAEALDQEGQKNIRFSINEHPDLSRWLDDTGLQQEAAEKATDGLLSCQGIWELTVKAYTKHAAELIDVVSDFARPDGLSKEDVKKKLAERYGKRESNGDGLSDEDRTILMINEIAARMIYKQLQQVDPNTARSEDQYQQQLAGAGIDGKSEMAARGINLISEFEQWQGKGIYLTAMLAMPYVQGLALFFLALTFPFFCFALIVPGRHETFLLWMSLWVWIKSWDFGFAVVIFIDELFYQLMPRANPMDQEALNDPMNAMKTILQVDPTYSVHVYYNIMATLMLAVPVVTGFVVKKGGSDLAGAITQGMNNFASKAAHAMNAWQANAVQNRQLAEASIRNSSAVNRGMANALSDPQVIAYGLAKAAMNGGGSAISAWNSAIGGQIEATKQQVSALGDEIKGLQDQQDVLRSARKAAIGSGQTQAARNADSQLRSIGQVLRGKRGELSKSKAAKDLLVKRNSAVKKNFNKIFKQLNGPAADQAEAIMQKTIGLRIQEAVYREQISPEYRDLANMAVMARWYNHDFGESGVVTADLKGLMNAASTVKASGAVAKLLDSPLDALTFTGGIPSLKDFFGSFIPFAVGALVGSGPGIGGLFGSTGLGPRSDSELDVTTGLPGGVYQNPFGRNLVRAGEPDGPLESRARVQGRLAANGMP